MHPVPSLGFARSSHRHRGPRPRQRGLPGVQRADRAGRRDLAGGEREIGSLRGWNHAADRSLPLLQCPRRGGDATDFDELTSNSGRTRYRIFDELHNSEDVFVWFGIF